MMAEINASNISVSKRGRQDQVCSYMFGVSRLSHLNLSSSETYDFPRSFDHLNLYASSIEIKLSQYSCSKSLDLFLGGYPL